MDRRNDLHWDADAVLGKPTADQIKSVHYLRQWIDARLAENQIVFEVDAENPKIVVIDHPLAMFCLHSLGIKPLDSTVHEESLQVDVALIDTPVKKKVHRFLGSDISRLLTVLGYPPELMVFSRHTFIPTDRINPAFLEEPLPLEIEP